MKNVNVLESLRSQSTWQLLGLGLITYGVYFAYYIQRQSKQMNSALDSNDRIPKEFVQAIVVMSYASLAMFIAYLFVEEGHPIDGISLLVDAVIGIMLIVWGFMARNRMNVLLELDSSTKAWFHGFWTFCFSPMYFNYKVNSLLESSTEPTASMDV